MIIKSQEINYYSGIGSRMTPYHVQEEMRRIGYTLYEAGYWLRSGGAGGADDAFESVAGDHCEIFWPWKNFNDNGNGIVCGSNLKLRALAKQIHPYWNGLTEGGKKLHTRNIAQILGKDMDSPVKFVVCWTPDGEDSGGTRTACVAARMHNVPVYNLKKDKFPIDLYLNVA